MASAPSGQQAAPCEGLGGCEELRYPSKPHLGKPSLTGSGCGGEQQDKQDIGRWEQD